jgi:hypothetical protein
VGQDISRRSALGSLLAPAAAQLGSAHAANTGEIERWGVFELSFQAPPETKASAEFTFAHRAVQVDGFYDEDNTHRIRFMPDEEGQWTYTTSNGQRGSFLCVKPGPNNQGPVRVEHQSHFAYADGTRYLPVGTTCYAWAHQGDALEEQTLTTLTTAPFNKMRMCVFPKSYLYNQNEPQYYPFERDAAGMSDFARFNPKFFQHFERRILDLQRLGIEADLILFHPYDRWGYSKMPPEADDRYLRYMVARFSAYRNVWWSLANEFDFMKDKTLADWDRFFKIVQESDPYQHLRSIHNGRVVYDHTKPWVTHASLQNSSLERAGEWVNQYGKPVIFDECKYEGNIARAWGNISPHEMMHRFWMGTAGGAYVGHGETYLNEHDILWWSKGGVLHGESPQRIAFLRKILEETPAAGFYPASTSDYRWAVSKANDWALYYFGIQQPGEFTFKMAAGNNYKAELINPWEMTITSLGGYASEFMLKLPSKPYLAVRIQKV